MDHDPPGMDTIRSQLRFSLDLFTAKILQLKAENALLREALEAVEWVGTDHPETGERIYRCPWCGATIIDNKVPPHNPPCKRQQALTATAPKEGGE